jgi:hypothetical protein
MKIFHRLPDSLYTHLIIIVVYNIDNAYLCNYYYTKFDTAILFVHCFFDPPPEFIILVSRTQAI